MTNFSLVESAHNGANGVVLSIVDDEAKKTDVHSDYKWVAGPDTWTSGTDSIDYEYDSTAEEGSQITAKPPFTPDYTILRREEGYNNIADQLDQLWHDIDNGKFGEDAKTGIWYNGIKSTKAAYPKT